MNVRDFEYIIEIANQRSISKAAASLFVSQPALSKYVQRMEESLGVRLFQRVGKQFIPTYAGERCVEKARQILSDNRRKLDELAKRLYERETITGEEFMEILNDQTTLA